MRLVTFGDSYTCGDGLTLELPSPKAWPHKVAQLAGWEVDNQSNGGKSNKWIAHGVVTYDWQPDDVCAVLWTYPNRSCIKQLPRPDSMFDIDDVDHVETFLDLAVHKLDANPNHISSVWVRDFYFYSDLLYESYMCVMMVTHFLEKNNIPFVQCSQFEDLITYHDHFPYMPPMGRGFDFCSPETMQELIEQGHDAEYVKARYDDHPGEYFQDRFANKVHDEFLKVLA